MSGWFTFTELDIDPGKPYLLVVDLNIHFPIRKGFLQHTVGHIGRAHAGAGRRVRLGQDDGWQIVAPIDPADSRQRDAGRIADHCLHEFLDGQRQLFSIARALAMQPELLICDESTSALDVSAQAQILNLLEQLLAALGIAYLFITHNFAVVEYLAHDVAVMYLGHVVEQGMAEQVLRSPRHSSAPKPCYRLFPLRIWTIMPPLSICMVKTLSPANPPSGCHFHSCSRKGTNVCRRRYPAATGISGTHTVNCHLAE